LSIHHKIFNVFRVQRQFSPYKSMQQQLHSFMQKLYVSIGLVLLTVCVGVLGYMGIENYSFSDAFYMTIITLSTVGYGEIQPLGETGRLFTSFLIITHIGVFAYAISLLSTALIEGDFQKIWIYYRMQQSIDKLQGHIIVCGYGRYGREICRHFAGQNIPFVVIEHNKKVIKLLKRAKDILYLEGDATDDDILEEAGILRASALVATLPIDADNLYVTLTTKQLNANIQIISRCNHAKAAAKLVRAGADEVIAPEEIGGFYMANMVSNPNLVEFFQIASSPSGAGKDISFEEISFDKLPESYRNKSIKELNIRQKTGASIVAIKTPQGEYIINPSANTIIQAHMQLIVLGHTTQISKFKALWQSCTKNALPFSEYQKQQLHS